MSFDTLIIVLKVLNYIALTELSIYAILYYTCSPLINKFNQIYKAKILIMFIVYAMVLTPYTLLEIIFYFDSSLSNGKNPIYVIYAAAIISAVLNVMYGLFELHMYFRKKRGLS